VTIAEPATLVTDYLLGAVSACLGVLLWSNVRWWAVAFLAVAASAFIGGTYHGFPAFYPGPLWKATLVAAGVASYAMVVATARATRIYPRTIEVLAIVKFWIYCVWIFFNEAFIVVVIDSGIALLLVALLHAIRGGPPWRWMISAVAVSVAAAGVQAMKLAPHPHFNHNDLYHVIQIAAMVLFYRGALVIGPPLSRGDALTTPPAR
jgi:hypothetical protein